MNDYGPTSPTVSKSGGKGQTVSVPKADVGLCPFGPHDEGRVDRGDGRKLPKAQRVTAKGGMGGHATTEQVYQKLHSLRFSNGQSS